MGVLLHTIGLLLSRGLYLRCDPCVCVLPGGFLVFFVLLVHHYAKSAEVPEEAKSPCETSLVVAQISASPFVEGQASTSAEDVVSAPQQGRCSVEIGI